MKIKVHYAGLELTADIPELVFNTKKSFINWLTDMLYSKKDVVYLVCIQDDIFVSENKQMICNLFENPLTAVYPYYEDTPIFIQEYSSYEDAYDVALDMKEESPLCYDSTPDLDLLNKLRDKYGDNYDIQAIKDN